MNASHQKTALRKTLRAARRALTPAQQTVAADRLGHLVASRLSAAATPRVALYLAADGELSVNPVIQYCWRHHIEVYLPVLSPLNQKMWFAHYRPESNLLANRFGIPEPITGKAIYPWQLNIVMMPLVGFDEQGNRLGMGGGYYDRVFANQHLWPKIPSLFGIAHECQKVPNIPSDAWDVALDGVFSDHQVYLKNA